MALSKITIELPAAVTLQYVCILSALLEQEEMHPALEGFYEDLKDRMLKALTNQLSSAEISELTKQ